MVEIELLVETPEDEYTTALRRAAVPFLHLKLLLATGGRTF